jgi:hypothetical protein
MAKQLTDSDRLDRIVVLLEALCRAQGVRPRTGAPTWSPKAIDILSTARVLNREPDDDGGEFPTSTVESIPAWRKQTDREAARDKRERARR